MGGRKEAEEERKGGREKGVWEGERRDGKDAGE